MLHAGLPQNAGGYIYGGLELGGTERTAPQLLLITTRYGTGGQGALFQRRYHRYAWSRGEGWQGEAADASAAWPVLAGDSPALPRTTMCPQSELTFIPLASTTTAAGGVFVAGRCDDDHAPNYGDTTILVAHRRPAAKTWQVETVPDADALDGIVNLDLAARSDDRAYLVAYEPFTKRQERQSFFAHFDGSRWREVPLPARGAHPEPHRIAVAVPPLRKRLVQVESRNDYLCIGLPRGTAGILRVLGAPPGTRYYHHGRSESWRRRNMRAAGAFGLRQATAPLRRQLERPIVAGLEGHQLTEQLQLKLSAGLALADLEDHAAAPALLAFLRSRELQPYPALWEDALDPLARLDPLLAQGYAIEALTRVAAEPGPIRQGRRIVPQLLPLLTSRSPRALQVLRRISALLVEPDGDPDGHDACLVLGARARLGDEPLLAELRPELTVELRTQRGVACYSEVISHVFPGRDPDEVPTLTHRQRYWEILTLLRTMRDAERAGQQDPRFAVARARLRSWLTQRAGEPDVRGDLTHRDNNPERRALHLAALAFLGDRRARTQLDELIRDPADTGTAPWLAAHQALLLELTGAADLAAVRLGLALTSNTRRFTQRSWPRRGLVRVTEHVEVIDELARRGDPRFALGLLDRNVFAREATVLLLARHRPPEACEIVGTAARRAQPRSIQDAFWALSHLGGACRDTMGRLARDRDEPPEVRGMALEALAMLRDSTVPALSKHPAERGLKAAQERAEIIHEARE